MCNKVNGILSELSQSSTGSPQGCVLSALLFTLYTNMCRSKHANRTILKFTDDTAIVSLLEENEPSHGPIIDEFVTWCEESFLQLNTSKTKDILIDFRTHTYDKPIPFIKGQPVDCVDSTRLLK